MASSRRPINEAHETLFPMENPMGECDGHLDLMRSGGSGFAGRGRKG